MVINTHGFDSLGIQTKTDSINQQGFLKTTKVTTQKTKQLQFEENSLLYSQETFKFNDTKIDDKWIEEIQALSNTVNKRIQFSMDYKSNEVVVRIIDKETKEVLRQLPPDELRRLHQKLKETAEMLGLFVDETA